MENNIIHLAGKWKSLLVRENELWLSAIKVKNIEKFEKMVQAKGILKVAFAFPFSDISKILFKELSEKVKFEYMSKNGKVKNSKIEFCTHEEANLFGEFMGKKSGLIRSQSEEKSWNALLFGVFGIVGTAFVMLLAWALTSASELPENSTNKGRRNSLILKLLGELVGPTGIIIIGSIVMLFFGYTAYLRYKNPIQKIMYD